MIILCDMIDNPEDLSKFHQIYMKYRNTMYYVAYDILKNSHDAEDVVEMSLIKVIGILNKIDLDDIDKPRSKNLMITIAKNTSLDLKRKYENKAVPQENIEVQGVDKSAEDIYVSMENYHELMECINELEEKYKDVFRLRMVYGLSSKEIGNLLNITEPNVNLRYMRARAKLKEKLEERGIHG